MTKIEEHFEFNYAAESSKIEFQATVNGLLELQALISSRIACATERGKDGVFFTSGELEIYQDWIMNTASALLEHYATIDRTNRLLNKRFKLTQVATKQKAA